MFWAPLSALLVFQLYGNSLLSGVALVEELLPFTDIFPTATVGWILQYTVGARPWRPPRCVMRCPCQRKATLLQRATRTAREAVVALGTCLSVCLFVHLLHQAIHAERVCACIPTRSRSARNWACKSTPSL